MHVEFILREVALGQAFMIVLLISAASHRYKNVLHSHLFEKDKHDCLTRQPTFVALGWTHTKKLS
jgi:hypothetical protein